MYILSNLQHEVKNYIYLVWTRLRAKTTFWFLYFIIKKVSNALKNVVKYLHEVITEQALYYVPGLILQFWTTLPSTFQGIFN